MADPTAGITTALANIVSAQLDAVETASSNPIKTVYVGELYNYLIIDPDQRILTSVTFSKLIYCGFQTAVGVGAESNIWSRGLTASLWNTKY
ncbi:hypothetical protein KC318_g1114 [Hortaea werneckii]|nr:hypothetical protein KC334_g471 [Hortaea werneckii]KAI7027013.1 hypothetical protein KC355_g474 [Hortaea werneckii]KAI7675192.1 hypothetical protein KC318_g1114 [Hortaea werneckii]